MMWCSSWQQLEPQSGMALKDVMHGKGAQVDVQVAAALARSAVNRTLGSPSAVFNMMVHNPDPPDTDGPGSQPGPQDPNFVHSFAWLDLTGEFRFETVRWQHVGTLWMCTTNTQWQWSSFRHTS